MINPTFTVTYSIFSPTPDKDGDLLNGDWKNLPEDGKIESVSLYYDNRLIKMEGYSEYNLLIENGKSNSPKLNGILKIFIMGRRELVTDIVVFDYIDGKIKKYTTPIGDEYQTKTSGWKQGIYSKPNLWCNK